MQKVPTEGTSIAKVLEALKEFNRPMSTDDLCNLLDIRRNTVHASINALRTRYLYNITTANTVPETPHKGKLPVTYCLNSHTPNINNNKQPNSTPLLPSTHFITSSNVDVMSSSPCNSLSTCTLTERCLHLILAKRTVSSGYVEEFFDITNEEARVLLHKVKRAYDNDITLTVTATVRTK